MLLYCVTEIVRSYVHKFRIDVYSFFLVKVLGGNQGRSHAVIGQNEC